MVKSNAEIEKILKHFLEEVQQKYQIVSAYLYGSFTRGTSNEWSDMDVAIISPDFFMLALNQNSQSFCCCSQQSPIQGYEFAIELLADPKITGVVCGYLLFLCQTYDVRVIDGCHFDRKHLRELECI